MLKALQRFLLTAVFLAALAYLGYEGFLFWHAQDKMPAGMTIGGVDVAGLTRDETAQRLREAYSEPVTLYHRDETVALNPADVGFALDVEQMVTEAEALKGEQNQWQAFAEFVVERPLTPIDLPLIASHDASALQVQLQTMASFLDVPARNPQLLTGSDVYQEGLPGYRTDVVASLPVVEAALYRVEDRMAQLVVVDEAPTPLSLSLLEDNIRKQLNAFSGVGSIFIMDLQTGEEVMINADLVVSGLSIVKIMILLETYRAIDGPATVNQLELIEGTMVFSGNYSANLMLDIVAGQDNAYLGVDILTESMQRLGLVNSFIVTPYEEPNRPGKTTMQTPGNVDMAVNTNPDPTMQTTAEDVGSLLSMIYYCAEGMGTLLAVYPDEITPDECQAMIDVMARNTEGNLIRFGVPNEMTVSHKHGWAGNTHGDAGLVFTPGGDYVLVEYMVQPNSDWLVYEISFPILREISRATYNYFNYDDPYLGNALLEADRFDEDDPFFQEEDEAEDTTVPEATATPSGEVDVQADALP